LKELLTKNNSCKNYEQQNNSQTMGTGKKDRKALAKARERALKKALPPQAPPPPSIEDMMVERMRAVSLSDPQPLEKRRELSRWRHEGVWGYDSYGRRKFTSWEEVIMDPRSYRLSDAEKSRAKRWLEQQEEEAKRRLERQEEESEEEESEEEEEFTIEEITLMLEKKIKERVQKEQSLMNELD
jgi:hypothetical protein